MTAALLIAGFVLLAILLVPFVVVSRIFNRLADQQRQIDALQELERVYRILSVIGLGVALLVTSYLYQYQRRRQTD